MRCPNCDRTVRDTASFCESCGAILQRDDPRYQLSCAHRLECAGELEPAIAEYESLLENEQPAEQEAMICKHLGNLHLRLGHHGLAKLFRDGALSLPFESRPSPPLSLRSPP